jgi:hypothetical protein
MSALVTVIFGVAVLSCLAAIIGGLRTVSNRADDRYIAGLLADAERAVQGVDRALIEADAARQASVGWPS